jgi:hypothetical protein
MIPAANRWFPFWRSAPSARSATRVRPDRHGVADRLRRLWIVGLVMISLGTLLFSVGMVGYCKSLEQTVVGDELVLSPISPLLRFVPAGVAVFLFGCGWFLAAALAEAALRVWLRQFRQLLSPALVLIGVCVWLVAFVQPRLSVRGLTPNWSTRSLSFGAGLEFELPPLMKTYFGGGMRIGDSSMGGSGLFAGDEWSLVALPISLVCLPLVVFWPTSPRDAPPTDAGSPTHAQSADSTARRLRRVLIASTFVLLVALALEFLWLVVFVYRAQVAAPPSAARQIASAALYWAGGLATLSLGAILAALLGLFITRTWRFGLRSLALATAVLAVCFATTRYALGDRLALDGGAVILVTHYDRPPEWAISAGMGSATQVRLPIVKPFSVWGPHSLLWVVPPLLGLPLLLRLQARGNRKVVN